MKIGLSRLVNAISTNLRSLPQGLSYLSPILSVIALLVSGASFWLSYQTYQDQTTTKFAVEVQPSYYEPIKFSYFPPGPLPDAIRLDAIRPEIDEEGRAIMPTRPTFEPNAATAFLEFSVRVIVTNLSKRAVPIKKVFYFVVDRQNNKISDMRRLEVFIGKPEAASRLPINIGPGESAVMHGRIKLVYESDIAEQLASIFEKNTAKTAPSLARLNLYAIATGEHLKGGSPFPHITGDYISSASLLVGVEDYTGNESVAEIVKLSFAQSEFHSFIMAQQGETTAYGLNPATKSQLGIQEKKPEVVILQVEQLLKRLEYLVIAKERLCCQP